MTSPDATNPACALFERAVKKRHLSNRIAAGVVTLLSLVGVIWGLTETGDRPMARMATLGLFGVVVGPIVVVLTFRASKGLEAIASPERIVWFYGVQQAQHITGVMVGTEDGKLHKMPVPSLKEGPQAVALLRGVAPWASEGFSEERRVRFREEPQALRTTQG